MLASLKPLRRAFVARWDANLTAEQRAFVIGYGRLGFRPALSSDACIPMVAEGFKSGLLKGIPERHADEMAAEFLADVTVTKAIKAYRRHLAELDAEPMTPREARAILADLANSKEAQPGERIRAVAELAKLEGWQHDAKARLRLVEAQAAEAEAKAKPPETGKADAIVIPPVGSLDSWGVKP